MDPKYKSHQLIQIPFPANGQSIISLNVLEGVDKIRISCFDSLIMTNYTPGILIWSNLVNNYIGTVGAQFAYSAAAGYLFTKQLEPEKGITYNFAHKKILSGDYVVRFEDFTGNLPANVTSDLFILIEYFIY